MATFNLTTEVSFNNNCVCYKAQSKKLRATNRDRISDLPESLSSQILSCLPTKDAVRTSVLSRNWEYKWTCISDIDVSDVVGTSSSLRGKHRVASFVRFVNRIVVFSDKSRIRRFRLNYSAANHSEFIETWITAVLRRGVERLDIKARQIRSIASSRCFSGWISLTELKLELSCTLNVSAMNCLFNLKSLFFSGSGSGIKIKNDQIPSTGRILMYFPVLEVVELRNCIWLDIDYVEIQAPELTSFKTFCFLNEKPKDCEIKIVGAKLDTFESHQGTINKFVLSATAVTRATLRHHISDGLALRAFSILKGFQNLKCLNLSAEVIQAFIQSNLIRFLSTLDRVKEVRIYDQRGPNRNVLEFLQVLPSLESVNINMSMFNVNEQVGEPLPPFIMPRLKKVKFTSLEGITGGLDLAESILKKAKNLETVLVSTCKEKTQISRRLSKLIPKGSSCAIHVVKRSRTDLFLDCMVVF